ncbi:MAG: DUF4019 domain-containing protein [Candidatus Omnitrophica bacterium]|nr:DUF4019 domain-containing protein [Candidatus Omnitrophota bacterium]
MWRIVILAGAVLLLSGINPAAADNARESKAGSSSEQLAADAANKWLVSLDNGKYDESWEEASEFFKLMVLKSQWYGQIASVRKSFGELISRQLYKRKFAKNLPGAPDGEYYIFGFRTSYAEKADCEETLTVKKDKDGRWHVAGYNIH